LFPSFFSNFSFSFLLFFQGSLRTSAWKGKERVQETESNVSSREGSEVGSLNASSGNLVEDLWKKIKEEENELSGVFEEPSNVDSREDSFGIGN